MSLLTVPVFLICANISMSCCKKEQLNYFFLSKISFPGGMMDDTDHDLITTALRETQEEIGLRIPREAVWGSFQSLPSRVV